MTVTTIDEVFVPNKKSYLSNAIQNWHMSTSTNQGLLRKLVKNSANRSNKNVNTTAKTIIMFTAHWQPKATVPSINCTKWVNLRCRSPKLRFARPGFPDVAWPVDRLGPTWTEPKNEILKSLKKCDKRFAMVTFPLYYKDWKPRRKMTR